MSKHISGPWSCDRVHPDCDVTYIDGDSDEVAVVYCTDRPERKASAILIAAAPELLEALQLFAGDNSTHTEVERMAAAHAAIKKARGEA